MANTASDTFSYIGGSFSRVDGPLKVSGAAKYTSDYHFPGMVYAVAICSTIANGSIQAIDVATAGQMPGVVAILHRKNLDKIYRASTDQSNFSAMIDERRPPMEDDNVTYYGQIVALVVAETFEQAQDAASNVKVEYKEKSPDVRLELFRRTNSGTIEKLDESSDSKSKGDSPSKPENERGAPDQTFQASPIQVDEIYLTPAETHNPIELHATIAVWDGTAFTIYEATQAVVNHQQVMQQMLGVSKEKVRVVSRFLGSGFGGKLWPWTHSSLAAVAARQLNRPVKLVLTRKMMFSTVGHRPVTQQRIRLGAASDGKLICLTHDYLNHTSILDDYQENCGEATSFLYSTPNLRITSGVVRRHVGTPTSMRGPGAVPGLFALESAMDELAIRLQLDPVELRLRNEPDLDEGLNIPFSSRHLKECLLQGAEKFGWKQRTPQVASMKRNGLVLGWGVAACSWVAARFDCAASVELRADGSARVACGTQDIGTGTYTMLAQIVAEKTGIPLDRIEVVLGDTSLPAGPVSGGSMVTASVIPPVVEAVSKAIKAVLTAAVNLKDSPFFNRKPDDLSWNSGKIHLKSQEAGSQTAFESVLVAAKLHSVTGDGKAEGTWKEAFGMVKAKVSSHSFGAHFVEIAWEPEIARLRVNRMLAVIDAGRILNKRTGANQIEGAMVMGIGMALFEKTSYDSRNGAPINSNLADYIVPSNADVPKLEVLFLEYPDTNLNELGARGIGEIGLAGTAAAITAAVYHATGVRVRKLPVAIEDLLHA